MTRVAVALMWLLHWLPLPLLAAVGSLFGRLAYRLARERRSVILTNLRLCFPYMAPAEREALARRHLRLVMRSLLERSLCWWASERRLRRLVRIDGLERLRTLQGKPLILLVPHFVGLDLCATRLALEIDAASVYAKQKDPLIDKLLYHGRTRFGDQFILSRQEGMRPIIKALRANRPLYYLPDMDYGARDALFVPFFGVPAATIPGVSRLARLSGAAVLPCIARMLPGGPATFWTSARRGAISPATSVEADTLRMNQYIEACVLEAPEQYYWVNKRFKSRPPGAPRLY